mgnify:CR=1 FL=1
MTEAKPPICIDLLKGYVDNFESFGENHFQLNPGRRAFLMTPIPNMLVKTFLRQIRAGLSEEPLPVTITQMPILRSLFGSKT